MTNPVADIQTDANEPLVFRTSDRSVATATVTTGSLWLRPAEFYRQIEDEARKDHSEGANAATTPIPLRLNPPGGTPINIVGAGQIGQAIVPHYIASFHGTSLTENLRQNFGGVTFGVRSFSRLAADVLFQVSKQIRCSGYRYGKVYYQYVGLTIGHAVVGGAAIDLSGQSPWYLNPTSTDVLRKLPVEPFIHQDEWRIAVFVDAYANTDMTAPLKINVSPDHFYEYIN